MNQLVMRAVAESDCSLFFEWANDPLVRQCSLNSNQISFETHKQWFVEKLNHPQDTRIFVAQDHKGNPLGQVRFELKEKKVNLGYSVDAQARGKGVGSFLIEKGMLLIKEIWPDITCVEGTVKPWNIASQKVFEKLGFDVKREEDVFIYFKSLND